MAIGYTKLFNLALRNLHRPLYQKPKKFCFSNIGLLINYVGFAIWLSVGVAVFCIPYLRWKAPNMKRPIKVNLIFPIVYLILTLTIIILPMIAKPIETGIGIAMILTAVPVYFIFLYWKGRPACVDHLLANSTNWLQRLLVVLPPDKEE